MTETQDTGHAAEDGGVTPGLLAQLKNTLWLPHDMDEGYRAARMAAARAMLADIDPAPGIEAMLACQMVATHEAAMACLGRSAAPAAAPEQTDQNLKHGGRLMALYVRQMDALGRHRARQQRRARERRDQEQRDRKPQIRKMRHILIKADGTEATPEELAEDRARRIADGTLVITPPLARGAAKAAASPDHTVATGDGPNSDESAGDTEAGDRDLMRQYLNHHGRP